MVTVVNLRYERADIKVTRPGPFGNQFTHLAYGTAGIKVRNREEAVLRYAIWFYSEHGRPIRERALAEISDGSRLGCVCVPLSCHGEIIAGYLNWKKGINAQGTN